jgi:hypothetical protein
MKYLKTTLSAIGIAIYCGNVYSQNKKIDKEVVGECGMYIKHLKENPKSAGVLFNQNNMYAFIASAKKDRAKLKDKDFDMPTLITTTEMMEKYCTKNQADKLSSAGDSIVNELVENNKNK